MLDGAISLGSVNDKATLIQVTTCRLVGTNDGLNIYMDDSAYAS